MCTHKITHQSTACKYALSSKLRVLILPDGAPEAAATASIAAARRPALELLTDPVSDPLTLADALLVLLKEPLRKLSRVARLC
jgi:hypothetical protein